MRNRQKCWTIVTVILACGLMSNWQAALAQQAEYRAPRTADGRPDLNGIWQAINTANWNIEAHAAAPGLSRELGAIAAVPPGLGVVDGGLIPYTPEALAQRNENFANRLTLDPEVKCYLPGVPRSTMKVLMPLARLGGSVRAITVTKSAVPPICALS